VSDMPEPCQVNVGAMKQFVPYAKFLVRAYRVKHDRANTRDAARSTALIPPAAPAAEPATATGCGGRATSGAPARTRDTHRRRSRLTIYILWKSHRARFSPPRQAPTGAVAWRSCWCWSIDR